MSEQYGFCAHCARQYAATVRGVVCPSCDRPCMASRAADHARAARAETLREVLGEVEALRSWADDPGWPFDEIADTLHTKLTETETTPPGEGGGETNEGGICE